jgi:nucleoside-diphosphate-sugar epimerase
VTMATFSRSQRTLITGASGLIGRAVVGRFTAEGAQIRCHLGPVGTADAGLPDSWTAEITDTASLVSMCDGVDSVVHLAGPPSVAQSFQEPARYVASHAVGTAALLEACMTTAVKRLVYVSSAEVYGQPVANPVDETASLQPRSPYAAAKVAAESLVSCLATPQGLEAVILRPFSVYGPDSPRRSLVGRVLDAVAHDPVVEVMSLRPTRDYVHVYDVADAIWRAVAASVADVEVFNIGTGTGTQVGTLIRLALDAAQREVPVRTTGMCDRPQSRDLEVLVADRTKAITGLGWRPRVGLAEGLAHALSCRGPRTAAE